MRRVWVQSATAGELRLATNLPLERAPAELISLMYRRRWQIEGFFKWLKCLLGCRHWFAESQRGVTVQLYLALIAAVLLQLFTGRRPTKRMLEVIQLYQLGWATLEELMGTSPQKASESSGVAPKILSPAIGPLCSDEPWGEALPQSKQPLFVIQQNQYFK